jgi:hypothetical protein
LAKVADHWLGCHVNFSILNINLQSINNIILAGMQSEIDLLRQHLTELEAKYVGIKAEKAEFEVRNAEIPELGRLLRSRLRT